MGAFSRRPTFRAPNINDEWDAALGMSFSFGEALSENAKQGVLDSFGLGTTIREMTSGGRTVGDPAANIPPVPIVGDFARGVVRGAYALRDTFAPDTSKSLSKEEYEASASFREVVPWDPGMTENRAAALAEFSDERARRAHLSERQPLAAFLGQLGGQMLDPINYVPVFGPTARLASVARFGSVRGRALLSAGEAAVNTAAFGVLTAGIREKLGDDVSFAAITAEVAMSALIGGAFGGGIGLFMRGRDARTALDAAKVRDGMRTIPRQQEASIIANEQAASLARTGEVNLSENSKAIVEKIEAEVDSRTAGTRALEAETASVTGSKAGEVAINANGFRVAVRPEVVELSSLVQAEGRLQVRNRGSRASDAQIEDIAIKLDAARLMPAVSSDTGAPIVGPDNIIDSGNGRVRAIQRAAEAYPEKFAEYRQAIEAEGYPTEGMQMPVLISRRTTPLSEAARAQFDADSQGSTARMGAVEIARMDRAALSDDVLDVLADGPVTSASNRAFVARFLAKLPQNERGALIAEDGVSLNADGQRRIETALVADAFGDVDMLAVRKFAEATDDNTRSIVGAMSDIAGRWSQMRRAMKGGELGPEFDVTPELTQALRSLAGWRDQAAREGRAVSTVIREGMAQLDLLDGAMPPEAQIFVRMFYRNDHFAVAVGRDALAARFARVIDSAYDLGRPQLFGDGLVVTKEGVLRNATNDLETDFFPAAGAEPGAETIGEGRGGYPPGADSGVDRQGTGQGQPRGAAGVAAARDFKAGQPANTLDELYAVAPARQQELGTIGEELAAKHQVEFRDPGVKAREGSAEKMVRKGYETVKELTDVVRGGFVVDTPAAADAVVADIAARFPIIDEGWRMTVAGYFDRKIMVQMPDGMLAEVQFWHPDMLDAKDARGGHQLYEAMRGLKPDNPKWAELLDQQRAVYREAAGTVGDDWKPILDQLVTESEGGRPASGNASSNASSVSLAPDSTTSAASASRQSAPDSGRNQAAEPDMIAGLDSQSKNVMSMSPNMAAGAPRGKIDFSPPRPDPVPEGLAEAEGRVAGEESMSEMAESRGVDLATGEYVERGDIDALREQGRLTKADLEALEAADQNYTAAEAYGNAMKAALNCII